MGESDSSSERTPQVPMSDAGTIIIKENKKLRDIRGLPRRQLTLISLTTCLNVLLWSSMIVLISSFYLIASDPTDTTNIATVILSITSSLASISYIITHTLFSIKQRTWKHQYRHPSAIENTTYVAVRLSVTLCTLWLLTCGWNMITVARRPVCLPDGQGLAGWESGSTCVVGRISAAISCIALFASCALFGMLAVVRRPFEAHILKHGYEEAGKRRLTPVPSRRPSPSRSVSTAASEMRRSLVHGPLHRSTTSVVSITDGETIDLSTISLSSTILEPVLAPSPVRPVGLGVFTSDAQPPPLPVAYTPSRTVSAPLPPFVQPTASYSILAPPPRMSALVAPSGFVPLAIPAQYSASVWRAVHPQLPSPLGPAASRSHPHLPHTASIHNFGAYRSRYSRSSISLTRPHRLSSAPPAGSVGWSSRSSSTGPGHEGDGASGPASGSSSVKERPSGSAVAYAMLNGTTIPGTDSPRKQVSQNGHLRHVSAPDAGATGVNAEQRMAKGWKPQLQQGFESGRRNGLDLPQHKSRSIRSSSAELLSRFSPDSSPERDDISLTGEIERELNTRLALAKRESVRKSRSESPLRDGHGVTAAGGSEGVVRLSRMPQSLKMAKRGSARSVLTVADLENKPLPKIAVL